MKKSNQKLLILFAFSFLLFSVNINAQTSKSADPEPTVKQEQTNAKVEAIQAQIQLEAENNKGKKGAITGVRAHLWKNLTPAQRQAKLNAITPETTESYTNGDPDPKGTSEGQ